jgi:hypothetical protein
MKTFSSRAVSIVDGTQSKWPSLHVFGKVPDADANGNQNWCFAKPVGTLPDFAICRARRKKPGGFAYCMVLNAYTCEHATRQEYDLICCHPKRDEIVARTTALQHA